MSELVCHFGKHNGKPLSEIPTGYLRWCVENIDPVPLMQYRKNEDGSMKTIEEIKKMEDDMRKFLHAAELAIAEREEHGEEEES